MSAALAVVAIFVVSVALFGWGWLVRRIASLPPGGWPLTIALGLAAVVFLGGVLNLLHLAFAAALDAVLIIGLCLAAVALRKLGWRGVRAAWWPSGWDERAFRLVWLALIVAVVGFSVATELKPSAFNHADDFEKYLGHPVRMLATGSVHDNPVGSIGTETLGGQAFLQGFILAHFPLDFINGADAVFCFYLAILLVGGVAIGRPAAAPAALTGAVAVVAIDPLYVNVSGLYSLVALSVALMIATSDPRERGSGNSSSTIIVGLLYAALIAIKPSVVPFLGLHFIFWAVAGGLADKNWAAAAARGLKTALWGVIFLAPWLGVPAPDYFILATARDSGPALPAGAPVPPHWPDLLATGAALPLAWYTLCAAVVTFYAVAAIICARRLRAGPLRDCAFAFAAFGLAAAVAYLVLVDVIGALVIDVQGALRYAAPALIAATATALALGAALLQESSLVNRRLAVAGLLLCLGVAVLASFTSSLSRRVQFAAEYGMPQYYAMSLTAEDRVLYVRAIAAIMHGSFGAKLRAAQEAVPPGEPILVWTAAPFLLDFARNPIDEVNYGHLVRPWSAIPEARYVLWHYNSYYARQPKDYQQMMSFEASNLLLRQVSRAMAFGQRLQERAQQSDVLFNDGDIAVFRLACPLTRQQC